MAPWKFVVVLALGMAATWSILAGGVAPVIALAFFAGPLQLLDQALGRSKPSDVATTRRSAVIHALPFSWVPLQLAMQAALLLKLSNSDLSPAVALISIVLVGVMAGTFGITVAHELMHRRHWLPRALSEILMTSVAYPHFCVEHLLGHHQNVATWKDPASARRGENWYRFFLRSAAGTYLSARHLETQRCQRHGIGAHTLKNRNFRHPLALGTLLVLIGAALGPIAVAAFLGQAFVAITLLEGVNYIEHYGLQRQELRPGVFEPVGPQHSWNESSRLSGLLMLKLQFHSDHHIASNRGFLSLRNLEGAPQLPAGYPTLLPLVLVPPIWFALIEPRLDALTSDTQKCQPLDLKEELGETTRLVA